MVSYRPNGARTVGDPRRARQEADIHDYDAFGLRFHSDLSLPELTPAAADRPPDVRIVVAPLSPRLEGAADLPPRMQAGPDAFQLDVDAGRYRVTDGRLITIDPAPGASPRDVRLFLLGSAMGALCHQRSRLALHAAALEIDGAAIAVAGPSGAGKSTLAALHAAAGGGVLGDDLCAVSWDGTGAPVAHRGLGRIKLWRDSAELAGWTPDESTRIADAIDKFGGPTLRGAPSLPLSGLYVLRPDSGAATATFRRLVGPEAAMAAVAQIYRWPLAVAMGRSADLFDQAVALARRCPVFELDFTHDVRAPDRLRTTLIRHAGSRVEP